MKASLDYVTVSPLKILLKIKDTVRIWRYIVSLRCGRFVVESGVKV